MAAPPLRIPVALDLDALQKQTQAASDRVGETLKGMARAFTKVNGEIVGIASTGAAGAGLAWSQSLAKQALGFAGLAAGAVVAFKVIGSIIESTREKLEQMVAIADKSRDATVSAQFFQAFTSEAQKLKVSVEDLEGALTHAFNATKEKSPIDLGKWEVADERITDVEKALRVYNETLTKAQGKTLEGLVLFRDADTQEKKVQAVLQAMVQLNGIGQNLAALELGEKMFGSQFVDRIRQGKTSAEEMLKTINQAAVSSTGLFSDDLVRRAKEIDDQLKLAHQRLDRELKPTWESLAGTMLTIKSLWAEVIDLVARAATVSNRINWTTLLGAINPGLPIAANLARYMTEGKPKSSNQLSLDAGLDDIGKPGPSRGTGPPPKLKTTETAATRDRFDTSADSIEKRTAAMEAENRTIDLGTEARERAKIAAQLETVAMQVNTEAGINNGQVTAEQRVRIDAVAEAYGRAAAAIEQAHSPLRTFARESANLNRALNQFAASSLDGMTNALAGVVTGTKTAKEAFRAMADAIIQDLARIAIRQAITGPLAGALGSLFSPGAAAPLIYAPGNAGGTNNWRGGMTWVGEKGPELLNLPKGSQVIPNHIATKGGGGDIIVQITHAPTFAPGMTGMDIAVIRAEMQASNRQLANNVPGLVRAALRNDRNALSG